MAVALRGQRALASIPISLTFVSGDETLLSAAQTEGLPTDNPFRTVRTG